MASSAHAYVRGNTLHFYEWLRKNSARALPDGPPLWICGDCHVGNIGPIADSDGKIEIQIRDLDQTVIGNPHTIWFAWPYPWPLLREGLTSRESPS
jgi:uncharacterized protein (DUF2252 family)